MVKVKRMLRYWREYHEFLQLVITKMMGLELHQEHLVTSKHFQWRLHRELSKKTETIIWTNQSKACTSGVLIIMENVFQSLLLMTKLSKTTLRLMYLNTLKTHCLPLRIRSYMVVTWILISSNSKTSAQTSDSKTFWSFNNWTIR